MASCSRSASSVWALSWENISVNLLNHCLFLSDPLIWANTLSSSCPACWAGVIPCVPSIPWAVSRAMNPCSTRWSANHCEVPPTVTAAVMWLRFLVSALISTASPDTAKYSKVYNVQGHKSWYSQYGHDCTTFSQPNYGMVCLQLYTAQWVKLSG